MISFGVFPDVSLASARTLEMMHENLLKAGTDPSRQKKLDKIASVTAARNTFGAIAQYTCKISKTMVPQTLR